MKSLFDRTQLSNISLKNRFIRSATWEELADKKGHMTKELFKVYENLANGGIGALITGYAFVTKDEQPNPGMMGIYNDSFIEEYRALTDMVHKYNTQIILQIAYGGSQTNFDLGKRIIWGPSSVENSVTKVIPDEMTKEEIKVLIKAFADGGLRAKKAGFDGVQLHGAHGYLLSQFLNPYYNRRNDQYGGSIENRSRIIFEIYEAVREKVGKDFPILIKVNCGDFMDNGLILEESLYISKKLSEMGIDGIEISGGCASSKPNEGPVRTKVNSKEKESYFKEHARRIASEVDTPIILVGGNRSIDVMDEILNSTDIEYFSLCRPLLCEPHLINRWAKGDTTKAKCVSCNKCFEVVGKTCIFNR